MPNRTLALIIGLTLATIALFAIALTTGFNKTRNTVCELYSNYPISQLPAKCLEYYHVQEAGR